IDAARDEHRRKVRGKTQRIEARTKNLNTAVANASPAKGSTFRLMVLKQGEMLLNGAGEGFEWTA
ncbi:MAG: hypothetical protein SGARI_004235, partial [Bacillariaceae sp.]